MTVQSSPGDGLAVDGRQALQRTRRRQRTARLAVGLGLAGAAGLTVLTLVTARGPAPASSVQFGPASSSVGVSSAGLTPAAEPSSTVGP